MEVKARAFAAGEAKARRGSGRPAVPVDIQ